MDLMDLDRLYRRATKAQSAAEMPPVTPDTIVYLLKVMTAADILADSVLAASEGSYSNPEEIRQASMMVNTAYRRYLTIRNEPSLDSRDKEVSSGAANGQDEGRSSGGDQEQQPDDPS